MCSLVGIERNVSHYRIVDAGYFVYHLAKFLGARESLVPEASVKPSDTLKIPIRDFGGQIKCNQHCDDASTGF